MEATVLAVEAEVEAHHWWFVVRRGLFRRLIETLGIETDAPILDIGTGTGANLRMLRDAGFGSFRGLDSGADAVRYCREKGFAMVDKGDICAMPFADESFELVLATDILEHVDDDIRALREIRRVLKPGGRAIITVPAFPSLWGTHDDAAHHKRRYRKSGFTRIVTTAGLKIGRCYYFNYLLFAPIWLARRLINLLGLDIASENKINTPLLNRLLMGIFELDVRTAGLVSVPFGVSILAIAEKPVSSPEHQSQESDGK